MKSKKGKDIDLNDFLLTYWDDPEPQKSPEEIKASIMRLRELFPQWNP